MNALSRTFDHPKLVMHAQNMSRSGPKKSLVTMGLCKLRTGWRRMADGGWRMADGGWRMADGGWRMADADADDKMRMTKCG